MFATHPPFKHPLQLDSISTVWTGIELLLVVPSLLVLVNDLEPGLARTFLLHGWDTRLVALCGKNFEDLLALQILLPTPSTGGVWALATVARIEWRRHTSMGEICYLHTDDEQCFDQALTATARPVGPILRSLNLVRGGKL